MAQLIWFCRYFTYKYLLVRYNIKNYGLELMVKQDRVLMIIILNTFCFLVPVACCILRKFTKMILCKCKKISTYIRRNNLPGHIQVFFFGERGCKINIVLIYLEWTFIPPLPRTVKSDAPLVVLGRHGDVRGSRVYHKRLN
jgi:hypothetical protein